MITPVWSERIGSKGVIDCDFDPCSRTIVAGDIDGTVTLLDAHGNHLGKSHVDLPVWGIAHHYANESHLVAVATAEKTTKRGTGYLLSDLERIAEFDAPGELWDCIFTSSGVYFTSWNSTIYVTDHYGRMVSEISAPGTPYGLAAAGDDVMVVLNEVGVGQLRPNGDAHNLSIARRFPDACYNLCLGTKPDLIVSGSRKGSAAMLSSMTGEREVGERDVCAIALNEEFLLAGSLEGRMALFHLGAFPEALATHELPGEVWNIALDSSSGLAYVACGDGYLHCFQIELEEVPDWAVEAIRSAVKAPIDVDGLGAVSAPCAAEIALGLIEQEWDRWSEQDLAAIAGIVRQWLNWHESPRLFYILGLAELEQGRGDEAILLFQRIENSKYGLKSLLPLARALHSSGGVGAAIRVLRMNLSRVQEADRAEYLFEIGRLHEKHGDYENAIDAYELVSALDYDYPGLRESLRHVRDQQLPNDAGPSVDFSSALAEPLRDGNYLSARRTADYDRLSYFLYEYGSPDEEAKKYLETDLMTKRLPPTELEARSLDIGCATGRWPEWFARRGYEAHGYDISEASIEICQQRAQQHPQLPLNYEKYDISAGARHVGFFNVVTCMMGTFNHVPPENRVTFLQGVLDSLSDGGRFVVSIWNASSPFCEFLNLDGQRAREALRRNSLERSHFLELLEGAGFTVDSVTPFCFLPNECYRVWDDELREGVRSLIDIENHLRANLTARTRSQMNFVVATAGATS
jgi:2-polyprenyl-3-methyl-5-hydroxy-6-metoxy-1,4-benzoquinol methylase